MCLTAWLCLNVINTILCSFITQRFTVVGKKRLIIVRGGPDLCVLSVACWRSPSALLLHISAGCHNSHQHKFYSSDSSKWILPVRNIFRFIHQSLWCDYLTTVTEYHITQRLNAAVFFWHNKKKNVPFVSSKTMNPCWDLCRWVGFNRIVGAPSTQGFT